MWIFLVSPGKMVKILSSRMIAPVKLSYPGKNIDTGFTFSITGLYFDSYR